MNILILADTTEHPFADIDGRPLIEWTTRSLPFIGHYDEMGDHVDPTQLFFAMREEADSTESTVQLHKIYGEHVNVISFPKATQGSLETAFLCGSVMELNDPLLIIDLKVKYNNEDVLDTFVESMEFDDSMVVSYFDPTDESTDWPFVYSDGVLVTSIVEHDTTALTKGGRPLIGSFWFSTVGLFMRSAQYILKNGLKTGIRGHEQFYISQVPSLHAVNAGAVFVHKVDEVVLLTPTI
jgi:hypothetical protein